MHQKDFLDALEKIVLGPERPLLLSRAGSRAHRLPRGRPRDPRPRRAGRRPGAPRDDRAARPGARRHLPAPDRPTATTTPRRTCARASSACSAAAPPRRSSTARRRPAPRTTSSRRPQLARHMVTRWGMSDALGMVQLAPRENPYLGGAGGYRRRRSRSARRRRAPIDAEVQRIIGEMPRRGEAPAAARIARRSTRWPQALLARETLDTRRRRRCCAGTGASSMRWSRRCLRRRRSTSRRSCG